MATFALVDCNNFYASCERLFRPNLKNQPVVVLSNNDGCVIARSQEAKAVGIAMGAPLFKIRALVEEHGVAVCSSNYALYGDISERVMTMLASNAPSHEVYSIDECFLDLDNLGVPDLTTWCSSLRQRTYQWTGIPVSIGIGGTKTLAKLATHGTVCAVGAADFCQFVVFAGNSIRVIGKVTKRGVQPILENALHVVSVAGDSPLGPSFALHV